MRLTPPRILIAIVVIQVAVPASAGFLDKLKDPETGQIDISHWLLSGGGFMPIPIIVTEPAVGFGLGFAPAFLHDFNHPKAEKDSLTLEERLEYPPSATTGLGLYTTNGSWLAGTAHLGSYRRDTIRYTGVLAYAGLNLEFYAFQTPFEFEIRGAFTFQDIRFRLGESNWFLGAEYMYAKTEVDFAFKPDPNSSPPGVDPKALDSTNAGLAALAFYDSRDTMFTPSTGRDAKFVLTRYDRAVGGDFDYWDLEVDLKSFHQVHSNWVVGWRVRGKTVTDGAPFYGLPFVWMRGISAMRYQGEAIAQAETEVRWTVKGPWNLVGFVGYGDTWSDIPAIDAEDTILAGGVGFRVNIAPLLGFMTGIDVARGPEDTAVYLQFGHAW